MKFDSSSKPIQFKTRAITAAAHAATNRHRQQSRIRFDQATEVEFTKKNRKASFNTTHESRSED